MKKLPEINFSQLQHSSLCEELFLDAYRSRNTGFARIQRHKVRVSSVVVSIHIGRE